jgi:hypothetical protein
VLTESFRKVSELFCNLFSFSFELFPFIRRLLNLFHELQTLYLDSSCPNVSLGIFLEFLGFYDISEFIFAQENISKNISFLLVRARRPTCTSAGPAVAQRSCGPRPSPADADRWGQLSPPPPVAPNRPRARVRAALLPG